MEKAVDYLVQHPVLFVIAVILSLMILLSLFRNVMKIVLAVVAVFVLYIAYVYLTGGGIHEAVQHFEQGVATVFHFIADFFKSLFGFLKSPKK
ncbi:MAG: hypothetical protein NT163_02670 [Chlorobiales bacterium]|nr:hypothetical protein [Chlorobiales bacterium]